MLEVSGSSVRLACFAQALPVAIVGHGLPTCVARSAWSRHMHAVQQWLVWLVDCSQFL